MRPVTTVEREVVRWFAERVDQLQRQSLLHDLDHASADEIHDEQLTIRFHIDGYDAPADQFQRPLPINAAVHDADGATLAVELLADQNGRLLGLDVLRFERGPVLGPDWATIRELAPEEIVDLGTIRIGKWRHRLGFFLDWVRRRFTTAS